jgi:uncharacterized protein YukE
MRDDGGGGGLPRGLPSVGDEFRINADALRDIAKRLQDDLDQHKGWGSGTLNDLQYGDQGLVTDRVLGDYPAGKAISNTFEAAYNHIGDVYNNFLTSFQSVIDAIKQTADNYDRADQATEQSVNQVGAQTGGGAASSSGGSPTTSSAQSAG